MPITKSAEKALRQNARRRRRNINRFRALNSVIKNYKNNLTKGSVQEINKELSQVYKTLDKAAKTGLIKKNKADRLKSRLTLRLKKGKVQ